MNKPTPKAIQRETRRLFLKHVREVQKQFPDEDFEDVSQYYECDFETQAIQNLINKKKRALSPSK